MLSNCSVYIIRILNHLPLLLISRSLIIRDQEVGLQPRMTCRHRTLLNNYSHSFIRNQKWLQLENCVDRQVLFGYMLLPAPHVKHLMTIALRVLRLFQNCHEKELLLVQFFSDFITFQLVSENALSFFFLSFLQYNSCKKIAYFLGSCMRFTFSVNL